MAETLPLFPEPESEIKVELARRLRLLADQGVYLGASSWKYEGWLGKIYSPPRYMRKGRFSKQLFDAESLVEYAETFPIVCGDFAFYQFPTRQFWQKLFAQVPREFLFAFKAPEEITRPRFPVHRRYGERAGSVNLSFLNADLLKTQFLDLLAPYAERVALIIFEFGSMPRGLYGSPKSFAGALAPFLSALPSAFRFAIEIRNAEFLSSEYMGVLQQNRVAHVFNAWTDMPPLAEQMEIADAFTTDFTAARALLAPRRAYEESVELFSPYTDVREPNQKVRDALRHLLIRAKLRHEPTYIFVNNRLEGFAPGTILGVTEGF